MVRCGNWPHLAVIQDPVDPGQQFIDRSLSVESRLSIIFYQHRHQLPLRIKGQRIEPGEGRPNSGQINVLVHPKLPESRFGWVPQQGVIGPELGVVSQDHRLLQWSTGGRVKRGGRLQGPIDHHLLDGHLIFSQRPGLIRGNDLGRPQGFYRWQLADQGVALDHRLSP